MSYEKSIFNIEQPIDNGILLYNTFTTSLVELSEELYRTVFIENNLNVTEISALYNMGFLVDDACDEIKEMENIRQQVVQNSGEK